MKPSSETSFEEQTAHLILNQALPIVISLRMQIQFLNPISLKTYCQSFNASDRPTPEGLLSSFDFHLAGKQYIRVWFDAEGRVKLEYKALLESRVNKSAEKNLGSPITETIVTALKKAKSQKTEIQT